MSSNKPWSASAPEGPGGVTPPFYCQRMEDLDAIALLADPVRRSAYQAVVDAGMEPVGRDEVAAAVGIGRTLAAFHLDKLVEAGLLEASFARRTGRSGPGAGRPAKPTGGRQASTR